MVLVLQHAWQIVAEIGAGVLKAVEEKAVRVRAPSLQALRQLEQVMLEQALARVQVCQARFEQLVGVRFD